LIDRYLIAIARGGAEPLLCVNKIDLLAAADRQTIDAVLQPYRALEIATFFCSTHLGQGIDALAERLRGKVAAVVGHSGVGKSSIINALDPEAAARVKEVGDNKKGRHTTTRSRLYRLSRDIQLIDTPGIRELGLPGLTRNDLAYFFPDLVELGSDCRFADCRHLSEPDCAVRSAAERNQKVGARLATFHRLHASLDT
jgi:ribosome biogenesis GTPase / thiamine phosphate phosphatase